MNRNIILSLAIVILPMMLICFSTKKIASQGVLYLHEQKKTGRSNMDHLEKFTINGDVILDFYADWCSPCQRMSPLIDGIAKVLPQFTFIKINRDFFMDLANTFKITSIPTLLFLRNGKEIGRYDGKPLTKKELKKLILCTYR